MEVVVWIVQGLVALAFLGAGSMKLIQPKEKLLESQAWVEDFSQTQIRLIGLVELLGALGVILPTLTGILPVLTPIAGAGLGLVMIGALVTHLRRGEMNMVPVNVILGALAFFVAFGRFFLFPPAA